jgi:hypothetical protein
MLRKLILTGVVIAASGAASAQSVPSATFNQTSDKNYALIAPGAASTEITVNQTGVANTAVFDQQGDINVGEVNQRAKKTNDSYIYQDGVINIAAVTQQYNFGAVPGATTGYTGQQTNVGFLSEFNSGGVSILALTGPGNTLVSAFGRTH